MKSDQKPKSSVSVVIPNLDGGDDLLKCVASLAKQTLKPYIIVVDNASQDDSIACLRKSYPAVEVIERDKNYGFTGGVNPGLERAIERGDKFVALLNDDAVVDSGWLKQLVSVLANQTSVGIVTSKIINDTGEYLDSTGDFYTTWGLPYPRGRREAAINAYDNSRQIFGASGGASLFRVSMLEEIGLFDDDFFAYYEDIDISFRAQLAGWKIWFEPSAIVYHHIGMTSKRMPGFATRQTMKNLPLVFIKNVPLKLMPAMLPRFTLVYWSLMFSAVARGQGGLALRGWLKSVILTPKKIWQRYHIQTSRKLSAAQVSDLLVHDLPPDAYKLRRLRSSWWRLIRKST